MSEELKGLRIAFLATNGVEEVELTEPRDALEAVGAETDLLTPDGDEIQAMNQDINKAATYTADGPVDDADASDYDGLVLPGGTANPDTLRQDSASIAFVRAFFEAHKPVAAICHGPWTLVEAGVLDGRTLTSFPSIKTDITNAGGHWVDEQVHVDAGLVTSRSPNDLNAFCKKMIEEFAEGRHRQQTA